MFLGCLASPNFAHLLGAPDALDGGDGGAVHGDDGREAGVDREVAHAEVARVDAGDHDGARAAAALAAAQLRAAQPQFEAQVGEQGRLRLDLGVFHSVTCS